MNIVWSVRLLYGMLFLSQTASPWNILELMHLSLSFSLFCNANLLMLVDYPLTFVDLWDNIFIQLVLPWKYGRDYLSAPYLSLSKSWHNAAMYCTINKFATGTCGTFLSLHRWTLVNWHDISQEPVITSQIFFWPMHWCLRFSFQVYWSCAFELNGVSSVCIKFKQQSFTFELKEKPQVGMNFVYKGN